MTNPSHQYMNAFALSVSIVERLRRSKSPVLALSAAMRAHSGRVEDEHGILTLVREELAKPSHPRAPSTRDDDLWYVCEKVGEMIKNDDDDRVAFLRVLKNIQGEVQIAGRDHVS